MKIKISRKHAQALRLATAFVDPDDFSDELQEALLEAYEILDQHDVGVWVDRAQIWRDR